MTSEIDALFNSAQKARNETLSKNPPRLTIKNGVGFLLFDALTLSSHEAGKKIPGRHRWKGSELMFEAMDSALDYVKRTWPNFVMVRSDLEQKKQHPVPPMKGIEWDPVYPMFQHQSDAFNASATLPAFAYFMDMGTGKSKVHIDNAAYLFAEGLIDRVLIVAPNNVHRQWVEEALEDHWPKNLPLNAHALMTGKKKPEIWGKWSGRQESLLWLSVNYDVLEMFEEKVGTRSHWYLGELGEELEDFVKSGPTLMGLDESHKIKNPFSQRSRAVTRIGQDAKYKRIMTGTPIAKGPEDYFSQFQFLDPKIIGCYSMSGFKNQFCQMGGFNNKKIIGYHNTDELHQRIGAVTWRVDKDEVLDLPPKLYNRVLVDLTDKQRKMYTELVNTFMTELKDGTVISADDAMVRLLRLQQVVCGYLPNEDETLELIPHNRMEAVDQVVEGAKRKVVIWARFKEDINQLMAKFGKEAVRYDGEVSDDDRKHNKAAFIDPTSKIKYFIGNPQAGGAGVDGLQGVTDTVIYYSNSFSSIDRWQSEDRTHRIGTKGTVNYYDIIARRTVDYAIMANLKRKKDIAGMSLEELKLIARG